MKKSLNFPICPYCGSRLNYAQAWVLRRRGEYICPECGGLSNIMLDPKIRHAVFFTLLAGFAFFFAGLISEWVGVVALCGIAAAGAVFFFLSPLYVRLYKPAPPVRRYSGPGQGRGKSEFAGAKHID